MKPTPEQIKAFYDTYTLQKIEHNLIRTSVAEDPVDRHLNQAESLNDFHFHFEETLDDDTYNVYNIITRDDKEIVEENVSLDDIDAFIIGSQLNDYHKE